MKNHSPAYPATVRLGGHPVSILSDGDLLAIIRDVAGDDLHDLVRSRIASCLPAHLLPSILSSVESISSDLADASRSLDSLYDQLDQLDQ